MAQELQTRQRRNHRTARSFAEDGTQAGYMTHTGNTDPIEVARTRTNDYFFMHNGLPGVNRFEVVYQHSADVAGALACFQMSDEIKAAKGLPANKLSLFDTDGKFYEAVMLAALKEKTDATNASKHKHIAAFTLDRVTADQPSLILLPIDDIYCVSMTPTEVVDSYKLPS